MVRQGFGLASTFDFGSRMCCLVGPDDSAGGLATPRRRLGPGGRGFSIEVAGRVAVPGAGLVSGL
jgi:hypothetical protein